MIENLCLPEYKERIGHYNSVYVFGAGKVSKIVIDLCVEIGISVKGIIVTDLGSNFDKVKGVNVYQIKDNCLDYSMPVLIAVLERGEKKIQNQLVEMGFSDIVSCPENILDEDPFDYRRSRTPVLEITSKVGCSVNCKYCPQSLLIARYFKNDTHRKSIMSFSDFKEYIDKCPKETIIDFSGFVEPFLNDDSIKMMEYCSIAGHDMTLFTTLRGLNEVDAHRVIQLPFKYVCLHVPDKYNYARIPMTDEYFKVLRLFVDSKKNNGEPFIDTANSQFDAHEAIINITKGRLKIYCEMMDRAGNINDKEGVLAHNKAEGAIFCTRAFSLNHNVLLPDGSLALCCNDFGLEHILGNLTNQTYDEIIHGEVLRGIKRAMQIDSDERIICRNCTYAREIIK